MRLLFLIIALSSFTVGQSGRIPPGSSDPVAGRSVSATVKELFEEANAYLRVKAADFEAKKVPFSDRLFEQTKREQRELAAKNAAIAGDRGVLSGDDLYYLGMLHWIAENFDGASESLTNYVSEDNAPVERVQSARSIITVIAAKRHRFEVAEKTLEQYLAAGPTRQSELFRMEVELAKAYQSAGEVGKMAPHAENAFASARLGLNVSSSRARTLDEILDSAILVFEARSTLGQQSRADSTLDQLRQVAISAGSPSLFYYAVDKRINYMIETGRKRQAIELFLAALADAKRQMPTTSAQADAFDRLKRREVHYKLLGETAPEFPEFDNWFPGKPVTMEQLRGKVVMIDFWAMWCGPCLAAFPSIREWYRDYTADGFEILGVTRYYGEEVGAKTPKDELELLASFRRKYELPYDFVVANDQILQNLYGASSLPTAVLIDRKGTIRYIESGTGPTRLLEMKAMIVKLLAEK